jgi:hypothetical protein
VPKRAFEPDYDEWEPPAELLEMIADKKLLQRDRVELIIAFYASAHGGNSPTYEKIGEIMGASRGNVYRFAMELTQPPRARAVKRNGQFWLLDSEYTHPKIKSEFSQVLRAS